PGASFEFTIDIDDTEPATATATTTYQIAVRTPGPRFLFAAGGSSTSTLGTDARTGRFRHLTYDALTGKTAIAVHPTGPYLYGVHGGVSSLYAHSFDQRTGVITRIQTIDVGFPSLTSLTLHASGSFLYAVSEGNNVIYPFQIDPATGLLSPASAPTAVSTTGSQPVMARIDPSGKFLYAVHWSTSNITGYSIDPATGGLTLIGTFPTGSNPRSLVFHPDGAFAYTVNYFPGTVSRFALNATTGALTFQETVSTTTDRNLDAAFLAGGTRAWLMSEGSTIPFEVDPATGIWTPAGGAVGGGRRLLADRDEEYLYVLNNNRLTVHAIEAGTGGLRPHQELVPRALGATGFALWEGPPVEWVPTFAFTSNTGGNDISRFAIDPMDGTLTPAGTTAAGLAPRRGAASFDGRRLYVPNSGDGTVSGFAIDPVTGALSPAGTAATGSGPWDAVVTADARFCLVAVRSSNTVAVLSLDPGTGAPTFSHSAAAGLLPSALVFEASGYHLFVANAGSNEVSRYNMEPFNGALMAETPKASLPAPLGLAADPYGRFLYYTGSGDGTVARSPLNGNSSFPADTWLVTGGTPFDIQVHPDDRHWYVAYVSPPEIRVFRRDLNGAGTQVGTTALPAAPTGLSLDVNGRFAYVTVGDHDKVWRFIIDPSTGTLGSGISSDSGDAPAGLVLAWTVR
ncbi:MAG TPA: beta-propeller fold lactonase family protein, partial [Planctomycetota bacterium]|nr:beta-propeller fold lactonase family protein [Planctomycetota bacterium]